MTCCQLLVQSTRPTDLSSATQLSSRQIFQRKSAEQALTRTAWPWESLRLNISREHKEVRSNRVIMATQVFKKKIYEVKVETHFVLKPSNEIQNQIQVTYLN